MRILSGSLKNIELSLIKTAAKCKANKNTEVSSHYSAVTEQANKVKEMRRRAEDLEQEEAVTAALTEITDNERDKILIKISALLKVHSPDSHESVFKTIPSKIIKFSRDKESDEIKKITERLKLLPQKEVEEYITILENSQQDFETSLDNYEKIKLRHDALRAETENLKKEINIFRENLFADLIKTVGKKEADIII